MRDYTIYAVDFDGTLSCGEVRWPAIGTPNTKLIEALKARKQAGDRLILWTCRCGELLTEAVDWCSALGLKFDAVNENLPEIRMLYGSDSRKVSADYYIDDRSIGLSELDAFLNGEEMSQ